MALLNKLILPILKGHFLSAPIANVPIIKLKLGFLPPAAFQVSDLTCLQNGRKHRNV